MEEKEEEEQQEEDLNDKLSYRVFKGAVGSTRTRAERYLASNPMQKKPHETLLSK